MDSNPKLLKAMKEIKGILKKHDIAGCVVLHAVQRGSVANFVEGHSEYLLELSPSYSCCRVEGDAIRVRARLQEDYNGDTVKHQQAKTDTVNMLSLMGNTMGNLTLTLMEMTDKVEAATGATHSETKHTPHRNDNN